MGMNSSSPRSRMALSEINVTPMVDVMLVLLVIFMVATPMMQQGIDVELPKTESSGLPTQEDPLVLVVQKSHKLTLGEQTLGVDDLNKKLKAIMSTRHNKQLYLQADKSVDYGFVAEVMAIVRGAGISNIGLVTIPKVDEK